MMPSSKGIPEAWAKPIAAGTPESGTGTTMSASIINFAGELRAHRLAHIVDRAAMHDGIRPGEIDIFENARPHRARRERTQTLDAILRNDDDLAIADIADEMSADDVERTGFGGEDIMTVELAENQRPDAEWIARADQHGVGQGDESVGPFEGAQGLDETLDDAQPPTARHEMKNDFSVGG